MLPTLDDVIPNLDNAKVFSKLDVKTNLLETTENFGFIK